MASETVDPIDWPLPLSFTGQHPFSATSSMQMRATNQECHPRELNPVPPAHEARALSMQPLKVYKHTNAQSFFVVDECSNNPHFIIQML